MRSLLIAGYNKVDVITATLFVIYRDELFNILNTSRYRCHIDNTYMGDLGYADDVAITVPS